MRRPSRRSAMGSDRPGGSRVAWRGRRPWWSPLNFLDASGRQFVRLLRHAPRRLAIGIERVGERDGVEVVLLGILGKRRIDVEHDGHVALLARLEALLA